MYSQHRLPMLSAMLLLALLSEAFPRLQLALALPSPEGRSAAQARPDVQPAPAFALKDLSGKTVGLADFQGKVVLLDFWATWCGSCVAAMPKLQKLHDRLGAKGFVVIGIATDAAGVTKVAPVVAKLVPSSGPPPSPRIPSMLKPWRMMVFGRSSAVSKGEMM